MTNDRASAILSLETANPPLCRTTEQAAGFMQRVEGVPAPIRDRIPELYARSGIDFRYSCINDYGVEPADFTFFPKTWALEPEPTTVDRNRKYREQALPLAESACRCAIDAAGCKSSDITHIVVASCTGTYIPGLDIELVMNLGLSRGTRRAMVAFMGCHGAFNALRVADAFCRSEPGARVLVVCVELCTLHFRVSQTKEDMVITSLFSDGAAALVLAPPGEAESGGLMTYAPGPTMLDDGSFDYMTWDIGHHGFDMTLSPRLPKVAAEGAPKVVDAMLSEAGVGRADIDFWALHPGGRVVVERTARALGLSDADVADSWEVLRLYGNMSSPTILFVLKRFFDRNAERIARSEPGLGTGVVLGYGPGLTVEGALVRSG